MNPTANKAPFIVSKPLIYPSGQKLKSSGLNWIFDQALAGGFEELVLPPLDWESEAFSLINAMALEKNLKPIHVINVDDFTLNSNISKWLSQGLHFSVLIYQPLNAAFLHRLMELQEHLDKIRFVLIPRKDWNFVNTFKSLPQMIRERLFVDFPVKLSENDPFYAPDEVEAVSKDLEKNFPNFKTTSFTPHFHLYQDYLNFQLQSISVVANEMLSPKFSVITTDTKIVERLQSLNVSKDLVEIILVRLKGENTQGVGEYSNLTKIWVGCEKVKENDGESLSYLRNISSLHAQGQILAFAEKENFEEIQDSIEQLSRISKITGEAIEKYPTLIFEKSSFFKTGGFDPLYGAMGLSELELMYRMQSNSSVNNAEIYPLLEIAKKSLTPFEKNFGALLFYYQYKDHKLYEQLTDNNLELNAKKDQLKASLISPQTRYRLIRIKDAYFSLYKATPKVAIEGNLKFLWSFIWPYLDKFYYKVLHKLYHATWIYVSKAFYVFHTLYFRYIHRSYHLIYLLVNRIYYKYVFTALFPVRKIYYFSRYQYEKRVLGLHIKEKLLVRGEKN